MHLLSNIRFTREKLNTLYELGIKYKWFGPEAPLVIRFLFYILRPTPWGRRKDKWISECMYQFYREFRNLQRASLVPPRYWDNTILNAFEQYLSNNQAHNLEQCINLYHIESANKKSNFSAKSLIYPSKDKVNLSLQHIIK